MNMASQKQSAYGLSKGGALLVTVVVSSVVFLSIKISIGTFAGEGESFVERFFEMYGYLFSLFAVVLYVLMQVVIIKPNTVGTQTFFGKQTGVTWDEGVCFAPTLIPGLWWLLPVFGIHYPLGWKIHEQTSIKSRTLKVEVHQRTNEGYLVTVFASIIVQVVDAFVFNRRGGDGVLEHVAAQFASDSAKVVQRLTYLEFLVLRPNLQPAIEVNNNYREEFGIEIGRVPTIDVHLVDKETNRLMEAYFQAGIRQEDLRNRASELGALRRAIGGGVAEEEVIAMYMAFIGGEYQRGWYRFGFR